MKILLMLIVAVAFFATGEALECYQCSGVQSGCVDPFDESATGVTKISCPAFAPFCRKTVAEINNGTSAAFRGCGEDVLNSSKFFDRATFYLASVSTYYCDENRCNGASTTSVALSMLMVLALPIVFRNRH